MEISYRTLAANRLRLYRYRDGMLEQIAGDEAVGNLDLADVFRDDDIVLLCSAELYDYLPIDVVEYVLTCSPAPEEELCERAQENGAPDTMTILLVRVGGGDIGVCEDDLPDDDGRYDWFA